MKENRLKKIAISAFGIYISICFLLDLFLDTRLQTNYAQNFLPFNNLVILPFSVLLGVLIILFLRKDKDISLNYRGIVILFCVFFLFQLWICSNIYFKTGWDVSIVLGSAEIIAYENSAPYDWFSNFYFSANPNNLTLLYLFVRIMKIGKLLHLSDPTFLLSAFSCLLISMSLCLISLCILKISSNKKLTLISAVLMMLWIGISPWMVIPYSDTYGILFPSLIVFFYYFLENKLIRSFLISLTAVFGYFIKPTVAIFLIAYLLCFFCECIYHRFEKKDVLKILCSVILGFSLGIGLDRVMVSSDIIQIDRNYNRTIAHYLMLGVNDTSDGMYSVEDDEFSNMFSTIEERNLANLEKAADRIKEMGLSGTLHLLLKKNMINYNDASFSFGREGLFYMEVPNASSQVSAFLRDVFYSDGKYNKILVVIWQMIWLFILNCIPLAAKNKRDLSFVCASLFGISLFLLIFECRARYLFLVSPLFMMIGMLGLNDSITKNEEKDPVCK